MVVVLRHAEPGDASGRELIEFVGSLPPVTTWFVLPHPAAPSIATPMSAVMFTRFMKV